MDNDSIFEFESRQYVNPQTGLNEQTAFIDTLRDIQAQNTAEINQNTYNLGSQVPSNIGGLTGSEGLWAAQYQTPQTDAQIANLRATAQQEALNQALQNESDIMTNRYKQALRGYYRKQRDKNNTTTNTNPLQQILDGLNLNTNTQNPDDWEVVYDENKLKQLRESGDIAAYQAALKAYNSGGNSQAFKYNSNGQDYYGVLYRDQSGKIIGADTYGVDDGNLSPLLGYDKNVQNVLNKLSGGKIYNLNGVDITKSLRF